jgi:hypothetical protein
MIEQLTAAPRVNYPHARSRAHRDIDGAGRAGTIDEEVVES